MKKLMQVISAIAMMAFIYGFGILPATASPGGIIGVQFNSATFPAIVAGCAVSLPNSQLALGGNECLTPIAGGICANSYAKNAGWVVQRAFMNSGVSDVVGLINVCGIGQFDARAVATIVGTEVRQCVVPISAVINSNLNGITTAYCLVSAVEIANTASAVMTAQSSTISAGEVFSCRIWPIYGAVMANADSA